MNHRVQLGKNVVPVCLQEWGSEEGVPEEVFQFLTAGHWCRIYATGYHSVIPERLLTSRFLVPTLLPQRVAMGHIGTDVNSEQPCDEFGWITVVRQSLGLQPPGDLVYLWSRVIGYDETPFLVVYNGMEQDFDLREFSRGSLFHSVDVGLYQSCAMAYPSQTTIDGYLTVSHGRGHTSEILTLRRLENIQLQQSRAQQLMLYLLDAVWNPAEGDFVTDSVLLSVTAMQIFRELKADVYGAWPNEQLQDVAQSREQTLAELQQELLSELRRLDEEGLQISGEQLHWRESAARISAAAAHLFDDPNDPDTVPDVYGSDSFEEQEEEEHASEVVADEITVTRRHNPTASMYEEDDEKYYHE
jgi:hypothetical protein